MREALDETMRASRPLTAVSPLDTTVAEASTSAELRRGTLVGRYVVLRKLGAGAMGVVHAAYDPELDRKVALKLLHAQPRHEPRATEGHKRLLREAQAIAKLSHPNVITVHDVGEHEGNVFLAMEFVEGQTLGSWLKEKRSWREILSAFQKAARGLAAAHQKGLVHRDFKPENVLVGDDGRVLVLDFGLARPTGKGTPVRTDVDTQASPTTDALGSELTREGSVVGSPAYMAPEQHLAVEVGSPADQFSFCVSLWEALFGQRPFRGATLGELAFKVTHGELCDPPRSQVPGWLRRAIVRGLSLEPDQRWPSMNALLATLERGQAQARLRRIVIVIGSVSFAAATVIGYTRYDLAQRIKECHAAGDAIDQIWHAESREALRAGLVATGVSYAPTVTEKVMPWINKQTEAWREATKSACVNATVQETWDPSQFDKAQWCLEERRLELSTLVTEMAQADENVLQRAVQAVAGLSPVMTCVDETSLAGMASPPAEDLRPQVAAVRVALSRARYLELAGAYDEGLQVARGARERAEALAWPPLTAAARTAEATLLAYIGEHAESETVFVAAYMEAAESGTWDVAASAASGLVRVVGNQVRHAEGKIWAKHATVAIAYAGDPVRLREAHLSNNLGNVHSSMGQYEEAMALYQRGLGIQEKALGPQHPNVAASLNNLGNVHYFKGEYEEAKALYERSLSIDEKALGPEHPNVAYSLLSLGNLHYVEGEFDDAKVSYERGLAIQEKALGSAHPNVAYSLLNLGNVHHAKGDYEEAKALYERSLSIDEKTLGPDHPKLAMTVSNLGNLHYAKGEYVEAIARYEQAMAVYKKALAPDHRDLALPLIGLGRTRAKLGQYALALKHLERALVIRSVEDVPVEELAESRFDLGQVLWDALPSDGRDRPRARMLIEQARDGYATNGAPSAEALVEVEKWFTEHEKATQ